MDSRHDEEYIREVMESGERLPPEFWEPGLPEDIMESPVFDGEKLIDASQKPE